MIAVIVFANLAFGVVAGFLLGYGTAARRTADALKLARYRDAIALADDLVKTPDALDLRPRAQKLLAQHHKAHKTEEN